MSLVELVAQTTRAALSTPMGETFIAPKILPVCCVCGLIRDESGFTPGRGSWVTQRTYRKTHGVNPANFPLTHTYCPTCLTKVQKTMRQYFRMIGTAA